MKSCNYSTPEYWNRRFNRKMNHNRKLVLGYTIPIIEKIISILEINKSTKILDVGCGIGNFTSRFCSISNNVVGIDHSNIIKKNPCKNISLCDATNLSFKNEEFDVVFCSDLLHHILDYERALSEMMRVSRKYIVIYEPNPQSLFMKFCALTRKEERLIIEKPLSMEKLKKIILENNLKLLYAENVVSYFFHNSLPNFMYRFIPKVKFENNNGTNILLIAQK